jgi:hypothetical protein
VKDGIHSAADLHDPDRTQASGTGRIEGGIPQATPTRPARALDKYCRALEQLIFSALQRGLTPEERKLGLFPIPLHRLANEGGADRWQSKVRLHKWLRENGMELVRAATTGSNVTGRVSQVKLTDLVVMTNDLEVSTGGNETRSDPI